MTIQAVGFTLDLIGKILIALSVLIVHAKMDKASKAKKDSENEKTIVILERELAVIGITLMVIGYILQLESKLYF